MVVRTRQGQTDYEEKLKKKVQTSGCAQGTVFGDLMEELDTRSYCRRSARIKTSWLYATDTQDQHRAEPLSQSRRDPRLRAVRGWTARSFTWRTSDATTRSTRSRATCSSTDVPPEDKIFYTTGRLTSEMVIKTVKMRIPILVSRSGFTAWGVELARKAGLTLIGRARGKRFVALAGAERIEFDADTVANGRGRQEARAQKQFCNGRMGMIR